MFSIQNSTRHIFFNGIKGNGCFVLYYGYCYFIFDQAQDVFSVFDFMHSVIIKFPCLHTHFAFYPM